jgi:hypothetical protein
MNRPSENQMHTQPNASDHSQHDLLAVAALADRGAAGEDADRARALIDACGECAALHADLVSLASATRQLPPIERPRDFQLRPVDAQRLRPNLVRRLFGSFGTARDGFSRPLAAGLTTLGLAGLMLGILPGALSLGGGLGGSAAATSAPALAAPAASAAAGGAAEAPAPAPVVSGEREGANDLGQHFTGDQTAMRPVAAGELEADSAGGGPVMIAGEPADLGTGTGEALTALSDDSTGASQLIVISGTLLIIGLGLFALRWTSRRFGG